MKADETLFDVETDKVRTQIPAPVSGVIAQILVQEGVTARKSAQRSQLSTKANASCRASGA